MGENDKNKRHQDTTPIGEGFTEGKGRTKHKKKKISRMKWSIIAVCLCLIVIGAIFLLNTTKSPTSVGKLSTGVTSDKYKNLDELLAYLDENGYENSVSFGVLNGTSIDSGKNLSDSRTIVSYNDYVYQVIDDADKIGIYKTNKVGITERIGDMANSAQHMFLYEDRLILIENVVTSEVIGELKVSTFVDIFDISTPEKPQLIDTFKQLGRITTCYMIDSKLYLLTSNNWSELDDKADAELKLEHGNWTDSNTYDDIQWTNDEISILGEPLSVKYVNVTVIDIPTTSVINKHAYFGDIYSVFYNDTGLVFSVKPTPEKKKLSPGVVYIYIP